LEEMAPIASAAYSIVTSVIGASAFVIYRITGRPHGVQLVLRMNSLEQIQGLGVRKDHLFDQDNMLIHA
jgi:hypothetical protein